MCGIVGYIGNREAEKILYNCLKGLEYRGYDSCGIALASDGLKISKAVGRVTKLEEMAPVSDAKLGIGHTRWATCGEPSERNAHPHCDSEGKIAVVHNGVIDNYEAIKTKLISEGYNLKSQTDTEVIAHLIGKYYKDNLKEALKKVLVEIKGSYALAVVASDEGKIVVAKKQSPLAIGVGEDEYFIASDATAFLSQTNRVVYLEDGDVAVINKHGFKLERDGISIIPEEQRLDWSVEQSQKGGYEHFMLKEIHEQPRVIRSTLSNYSKFGKPIPLLEESLIDSILILACGTSYHAGMVGKYILEEMLKIPVRVEIASEYNCLGKSSEKTLAIVISQSGETADTIKVANELKNSGHNVLAITNTIGSTLARIADEVIYTYAGPEISVASTKCFTAQLMVFYWIALSYYKGDTAKAAQMLLDLRRIPNVIQTLLDRGQQIAVLGKYLSRYKDVFYIGRGINYPIALEGALKLKEVSYIHAEGYAAGELKHGPFALLDENTPVIVIVARDKHYNLVLNNIREIKARNAPVIAITSEDDGGEIEKIVDYVFKAPKVDSIFSVVTNTVITQFIAYYAAKELKRPVDFPKNLAKSVTVE